MAYTRNPRKWWAGSTSGYERIRSAHWCVATTYSYLDSATDIFIFIVEDDGLQRLKDDADLEVASVGSTPKDSPDHGSKSVWGGGGKKGRLSRKALWVSVVCVVVLAIIGTVVGTVVGIKASTNDGTSSDSESTESDFKDPFAQKMGLTTWVNGSHNFHIFYQGADGWIRHRVYDRDRYFREKADGWGPPSEAPKLALARPGSALSVAAAKLPGKPKQENQLPAVPSYEQPIAGKYEELEPAMAIYQVCL